MRFHFSIESGDNMAEQFRKKRREILMKVSTGHLTPEQADEALLLLEEEQLRSNGETAYVEMRREMRSMERKADKAKERLDETMEYMENIEERMAASEEWVSKASKRMEEAQEAVEDAKRKLETAGAEHFSKTTYENTEKGCRGAAEYLFSKPGGGVEKIVLLTPFLSAFGGPVDGNVAVSRKESAAVGISMYGFFEANDRAAGRRFQKKMLPKVAMSGTTAAVEHPLADMEALPDGIECVGINFVINAPARVETELSERREL